MHLFPESLHLLAREVLEDGLFAGCADHAHARIDTPREKRPHRAAASVALTLFPRQDQKMDGRVRDLPARVVLPGRRWPAWRRPRGRRDSPATQSIPRAPAARMPFPLGCT